MSAITSFYGSYRFLSNFHPSEVTMHGELYPTIEHAFQAAKTNAKDQREQIRMAPTPGQAKLLGRSVTLRAGWEDIKIDMMEVLLERKFRDRILRDKLLATGERELVEGNTWGDKFWGVCDGEGRNELGKALMRVRAALRKEA